MTSINNLCDEIIQTDLLIVGSEGAGAHAAIEAIKSGIDILIVTKGKMSKCGASQMAGADFNVDGQSAKSLGFEGMGCIHPRQIQVVHEAFSPTESEIVKAQKIIVAFEERKIVERCLTKDRDFERLVTLLILISDVKKVE